MKTVSYLKPVSFVLLLTVVSAHVAFSQTYTAPVPPPVKEVKIVRGKIDTVTTASHVVVGVAPKGSKVWVNKNEVKVYKTGSFGYETRLQPGQNHFEVESQAGEKKDRLTFSVFYNNKPKPFPPADLVLESVSFFPEGKTIWIMEGEPLQIRVVTKAGAKVSWYNGEALHELKEASKEARGQIGPGRSIYQGVHIMDRTDMLYAETSTLKISADDETRTPLMKTELRVLTADHPITVRTRNGAFLNESWGGDRLGGSKINLLDSGICMQVVGKTDALFKVRLGNRHTAYIPESVVEVLPEGYYAPVSLSGSWTAGRSGKFDVITIPLPARHPYTVYQEMDPNRLVVDLYGVMCNSNWITQALNLKEIKRVDLRQVEPDVLRFVMDLNDQTPWGYKVEYSGNNLLIKIKHKPDLAKVSQGDWSGLIFAVDAGHGGSDSKGAISPAGYMEKDQNLAMSYMLKEMLEQRGAKVVLTRPQDKNVSMDDRKKTLNDTRSDFLISIHCNAGGNPLRTGGTSTYYKHIGFRPLSTAILARLLELPVQNFGNVGHFNFSLNAVTECPNVLVETLFMSNLEDEERVVDPVFQRKMMEKVLQGVEDYLRQNI